MDQRLSIITIGVRDLATMRRFYEDKFGWKPVAANNDIVFFKLNGFLLGLYPGKAIGQEAGVPIKEGVSTNFTLAYLVKSREEVDELFAEFVHRGVKILKLPSESSFGGYGGYVSDSEGNLWEIGFNPYVELNTQNAVVTHRNIDQLGQ